jgi:hypothetical protein
MTGQCVRFKRNGDRCGNMTQAHESFCGVHGGLSARAMRLHRRQQIAMNSTGLGVIVTRPGIFNTSILSANELEVFRRYMENMRGGISRERHESRVNTVESLIDSFGKVSFTEKVDCCICLDTDIADPAQLSCCKQAACSGCVKTWLNTSNTCPFCRATLVVV